VCPNEGPLESLDAWELVQDGYDVPTNVEVEVEATLNQEERRSLKILGKRTKSYHTQSVRIISIIIYYSYYVCVFICN